MNIWSNAVLHLNALQLILHLQLMPSHAYYCKIITESNHIVETKSRQEEIFVLSVILAGHQFTLRDALVVSQDNKGFIDQYSS